MQCDNVEMSIEDLEELCGHNSYDEATGLPHNLDLPQWKLSQHLPEEIKETAEADDPSYRRSQWIGSRGNGKESLPLCYFSSMSREELEGHIDEV